MQKRSLLRDSIQKFQKIGMFIVFSEAGDRIPSATIGNLKETNVLNEINILESSPFYRRSHSFNK